MNPTAAEVRDKRPRSVWATLLALAGGGWLALAVWRGGTELAGVVTSIRVAPVLLAELPVLAMVCGAAAIYYLLLRRMVPALPPPRVVVASYLTAQSVRHVPGRIWSILYLARRLSQWVPAAASWLANAEHFLAANLTTVGVAVSVLLYRQGARFAALGAFGATVAVLYIGLRGVIFETLIRRVGRRAVPLSDPVDLGTRARASAAVVCLLLFDWLPFVLLWVLIVPRQYALADSVALAVSYAMAWLVGVLAFVVPGGLVVREASFVWLGGLLGYDAAALFVFGVVARFLFTVADVISTVAGLYLGRDVALADTGSATDYWNALGGFGPDAAVIDPLDRSGHKNRYIAALRDRAIIDGLAPLPPASKVLDLGCGSGNLAVKLADCGYWPVGVDIARDLLRQTGRHVVPQPHLFVQYDGVRLPLAPQSLDGCVSYVVLTYLVDDGVLQAMARAIFAALKPGGKLVIVEQTRRRRRRVQQGLKLQRTSGEWLQFMHAAGFRHGRARVIRRGHFPMLYLIGGGWIGPRWYARLIALESWLGRSLDQPAWDYADTLFTFTKPAS